MLAATNCRSKGKQRCPNVTGSSWVASYPKCDQPVRACEHPHRSHYILVDYLGLSSEQWVGAEATRLYVNLTNKVGCKSTDPVPTDKTALNLARWGVFTALASSK